MKKRTWSADKAKQFAYAGRTEDPYLPEEGQEASLCTECQALYQNKRWFFDQKLYDRLAGTGKVREVVCPTCRKVQDRYPEGYLTVSGDFFKEHQEEINTLLQREAERVGKRSVLDRIIQMAPEGSNKLVVETTTEKLAQHLGRALHKAYKGELNFNWGDKDKFVRVYWSR